MFQDSLMAKTLVFIRFNENVIWLYHLRDKSLTFNIKNCQFLNVTARS